MQYQLIITITHELLYTIMASLLRHTSGMQYTSVHVHASLCFDTEMFMNIYGNEKFMQDSKSS